MVSASAGIVQGRLEGMPPPWALTRFGAEGEVVVSWGPKVLFHFDADDVAMRNLAMVALSEAGVACGEVARTFGVSREHVSRIRSKAARQGSAGLFDGRGRPRVLDDAEVKAVYALADQGEAGAEIAVKMDVSAATISRCLTRRRRQIPAPQAEHLDLDADFDAEIEAHDATEAERAEDDGDAETEPTSDSFGEDASPGRVGSGLARLEEATLACRYAGAMLLYPFLDRMGAGSILCGLDGGPARSYDTISIVLGAIFGFALGEGSIEAVKHLSVRDAGALVGLERFPEVRTLRPRLAAIAERTDALDLQVSFAKAMLAADDHPPEVFFCDDHFVAYTGAAPVAKGYNIRRHIAERGRDDTVIVDDRWRAICFASGEPRGLSVSLPELLGRLKDVCGGRRVTLGFDRGGSYPKVFSAIKDAGMDWVTWRRAPLATPGVEASRRYADIDGKRFAYVLADEIVELAGYGPARQISVIENAKVVFQILTSDTLSHPVRLIRLLKARWCIENAFKYAEDHQAIHWLCTYGMDIEANTAKVANPARRQAKERVHLAEVALSDIRGRIGEIATTMASTPADANTELARLSKQAARAETDLDAARALLKPIPAKLPANHIDPDAKRAKPRLGRRALQMVCRLLAYNAELDLARRLDSYLVDADNYRSLTRHLLHLGGTITYGARGVTVVLDRPHPPRLARAVGLLVDQVNLDPPTLPGDNRPITYMLAPCND